MRAQAGRLSRIMDKGGGAQLRPGSKEEGLCECHHGGERLRTDWGDLKGYQVSGLCK